MSKVEMLRAMVNQRLTAVVEEICGLFETTIAEYEDIVCRSREETKKQQQLLEAVISAGLEFHNADIQQLLGIKEERQESSSSLDHDTPELPHIKAEPEELWSSHIRPHLQGLEMSPWPGDQVKVFCADVQQVLICKKAPSKQQEWRRPTLNQDDPGSPHTTKETHWSRQEVEQMDKDEEKAHQRQTQENKEAESAANRSAQKMETDGEDCGGAEPSLQSDSEKTSNSSDGVTEDSDDDWKRMPRQQLMKYTKIPGSEPANKLAPDDFKPACEDKSLDSSEPETEDSDDDWKQGSKPQYYIATVKTEDTSESSSKSSCQTEKAFFSCSTCGKRFYLKHQLRKHTKTHSREATFCCSVCRKQFIHKANLNEHMRSHSSASKKYQDSTFVKIDKTKNL